MVMWLGYVVSSLRIDYTLNILWYLFALFIAEYVGGK